jgi:hypothetical protein
MDNVGIDVFYHDADVVHTLYCHDVDQLLVSLRPGMKCYPGASGMLHLHRRPY